MAGHVTPDRLFKVEQLLNDGWSHRAIAEYLKLSTETIRRHFPGTGWPVGWGGKYAMAQRRLEMKL